MPKLIDGLRSPTATRESQYRHIHHIDSMMRQLVANLPSFLRPGAAEDPSWPSWVRVARSALTFSAADKVRSYAYKVFLVYCFIELTIILNRSS